VIGIREMFAELDGYQRYEDALVVFGALANDKQRERWRANKRRQRAEGKTKPDRDSYKKRWKNDAAFRERRREYWRAYDKKRKAARAATREIASAA
jgi:hypothetical protein